MVRRTKHFCLTVAAALLLWCGPDAKPHRDAGVDASVDAPADSGKDSADGVTDAADAESDATVDAGWPFEECGQYFRDMPWLRALSNASRTDVEYPMVVVESSESSLRAEGGPKDEDPEEEMYVDLEFPFPLGPEIERPGVGEVVTTRGGVCDGMLVTGYVRIRSEDGRLLWEGGSPDCADSWAYQDAGLLLGERVNRDVEPCSEELRRGDEVLCCCRTRVQRDVILHPDGDSVLVPGEDREIEIDGARFLASAQGSFEIVQAPCEYDRSGIYGSAFVARLADQ